MSQTIAETPTRTWRSWAPPASPKAYVLKDHALDAPLRWRKPSTILVDPDLFALGVPSDHIAKVFAVAALSPKHVFLVRARQDLLRMRSLIGDRRFQRQVWAAIDDLPVSVEGYASSVPPAGWWPLPNVWLGVDVTDQRTADAHVPVLLDTPAAVRWVNVDAPQGSVELPWLTCPCGDCKDPNYDPQIDWVVVNGASGLGAEPMHPDWVRALREQCRRASVPFLFRGWGDWAPDERIDADGYRHVGTKPVAKDPKSLVIHVNGATALTPQNPFDPWERGHGGWHTVMRRLGAKRAGRLLDGQLHDDYPRSGGAR